MAVSVGTIQLTLLSIAIIMHVPTSVCSYAVEVLKTVLLQSCSIAIMLVVLCAKFILVDLFIASIKFLHIYACENVYTANMWLIIFIEIIHMEVCYHHAGSIFYNELCT